MKWLLGDIIFGLAGNILIFGILGWLSHLALPEAAVAATLWSFVVLQICTRIYFHRTGGGLKFKDNFTAIQYMRDHDGLFFKKTVWQKLIAELGMLFFGSSDVLLLLITYVQAYFHFRNLSEIPVPTSHPSKRKRYGLLRALLGFRWLCDQENRRNIELSVANLKKDVREMRREGLGRIWINIVLAWKMLTTIIPILWDGVCRTIAAILPIARIIQRLKF